ncbi:hypothetical protein P9272_09190 [Mesorhizobium sp. WSM4976]|uniref:hypothetical protein n=1 Tax=Mesorhizobium sp. WSM4976 TaxID=3038549 RepID=UPI002417D913|nr:hypothetical protein [Mesorhizobium sp. WSM4976]MDG4893744.1 hypothetical protein [Mesorhizobium sp. WSM4976]
MTVSKAMAVAGLVAATVLGAGSARADDMLGSYVARISDRDHRASDGYPLSNAAQMVRTAPTGTSSIGATATIRAIPGSAATARAPTCIA